MFTDRTPEADTLPVVHIAGVLTQGTEYNASSDNPPDNHWLLTDRFALWIKLNLFVQVKISGVFITE